eukprot:3008161-Rhodomonas_salina.2
MFARDLPRVNQYLRCFCTRNLTSVSPLPAPRIAEPILAAATPNSARRSIRKGSAKPTGSKPGQHAMAEPRFDRVGDRARVLDSSAEQAGVAEKSDAAASERRWEEDCECGRERVDVGTDDGCARTGGGTDAGSRSPKQEDPRCRSPAGAPTCSWLVSSEPWFQILVLIS